MFWWFKRDERIRRRLTRKFRRAMRKGKRDLAYRYMIKMAQKGYLPGVGAIARAYLLLAKHRCVYCTYHASFKFPGKCPSCKATLTGDVLSMTVQELFDQSKANGYEVEINFIKKVPGPLERMADLVGAVATKAYEYHAVMNKAPGGPPMPPMKP